MQHYRSQPNRWWHQPYNTPSSQTIVQSSPSQVSPSSLNPLPQAAEQSGSFPELHPGAQHPSLTARHSVTGLKTQAALHDSAAPTRTSVVQASPSSQLLGQSSPSQVSPSSMEPFPQLAEQSLSEFTSQSGAQHPSPLAQTSIATNEHCASQVSELPVRSASAQALGASHAIGQSPSQSSPPSNTPLPQIGEQSASLFASQPGAQQPSSLMHAAMGSNEQLRSQVSLVPEELPLRKHWSALGRPANQSPSQSSSPSTTPLPQLAEQSPSSKLLQPVRNSRRPLSCTQ